MQNKKDAGCKGCRTQSKQDTKKAGHEARLQDMMDAGQNGCRTKWMQDIKKAGHKGCRT